MARVKRAMIRRSRIRKLRARVKGFFIGRQRLRQAIEARMKADHFAYVGRKLRKRDFRALWTQRINAAARTHGLSYSKLIHGLKKGNISINRKMLSDLAVREPAVFAAVVDAAKASLAS